MLGKKVCRNAYIKFRLLFDETFIYGKNLFFPMVQFGKLFFEKSTRFLFRPLRGIGMFHQKIGQFFYRSVNEFSLFVTPFAVFFVEFAVRFFTDARIVQRHAAALADQCARTAQQSVDRNVEKFRKQFHRIGVGHGIAVFPARYRLPCYKKFVCKFFLRQAPFASEEAEFFFLSH